MSQNPTPGDDITVCSLNVRGLSTNQKRREIFFMVEKKKKRNSLSISYKKCIAQEKQKSVGTRNGGYSTIFTHFSSSRAGVGVLFNNNFHFHILKYFVDPEGRFIIADIKVQDNTLTLVNMYAPNKDKPTFFKMFVKNCLLLTVIS